ncbi:PQQ-binding-like beta-propeller repeat protein [Collinsella sp. AGMB00827]|uniref:PQQ-binding-like beta-propeller repeat protein n=1 Tax=Collinsella ureilytica TaxID=2869515 RepID=A0ABS7MHN6_9ACTN|nr:PQQ-binding-like beta-propeller repeat protein [Collinsella urealyticum]MBY4796874.1 PQQ-binding-like beta-propeller repeat protein [Collinsella urealyticum]
MHGSPQHGAEPSVQLLGTHQILAAPTRMALRGRARARILIVGVLVGALAIGSPVSAFAEAYSQAVSEESTSFVHEPSLASEADAIPGGTQLQSSSLETGDSVSADLRHDAASDTARLQAGLQTGAAAISDALQAAQTDPANPAVSEHTGAKAGEASSANVTELPSLASDAGTSQDQATDEASESKLDQAVAALTADGFGGYRALPRYGRDTNLNRMIETRLADLGYTGISSQIISATFSATDPSAQGGIDCTDRASNGDITWFFLDPAQKTSSTDYSVLLQFTPVYRLSDGETTREYRPRRASHLPWNEDAVARYLEAAAAKLVLPDPLATGTVPEGAGTYTLPSSLDANGLRVATISWETSDASVARIQERFVQGAPEVQVRITNQPTPATVTLTAQVSLAIPGYGNAPDTTYERAYPIEVAPRSGASARQIERRLKALLARVRVRDFATSAELTNTELAGDIRLSVPHDLKIDGKYYKLTYTSSDPAAIRIDGYRGEVTRPLAADPPRSATLTVSLSYEGTTVTRELGSYSIAVLAQNELDRAISFMEQVKAGFGKRLLAGMPASAVEGDLKPFASAQRASDGSIEWSTLASLVPGGIEPVALPGWDPMASQPWRLFRSSAETVLTSESLHLTRPDFDTQVTVDAQLTYKRYEATARAHPDDVRLAKLIDQPVSLTFTAKGVRGSVDPEADAVQTVTARVQGVAASGTAQAPIAEIWVPKTQVSFKKREAKTAWDIFSEQLLGAGYSFDMSTGSPGSITTPDGRTLKTEQVESAWSYWSFIINGKPATTYPQKTQLSDGDTIELIYLAAGQDPAAPGALVIHPNAPRPTGDPEWAGFRNGGTAQLHEALVPTGTASAAWMVDLKREGQQFASVGDPIIWGSALYTTTDTELIKIDRATGAMLARTPTFGTTSYFSRPVFASGLIILPSNDGSITAFTADTLTCVWRTPALPAPHLQGRTLSYQAASSLTVMGGVVLAPFAAGVSYTGPAQAGALVCVRIADGAVLWTRTEESKAGEQAAGYYWAGAAASSQDACVIGGEDGRVRLIDLATGTTLSEVQVGAPVRTTIASAGNEADGEVFLAVGRAPATLVKLVRSGNELKIAGKLEFAATSTSTPAISKGRAYIGGIAQGGQGVFSVVDLATMHVVEEHLLASGAEVKASPLIAELAGDTHVFFTCNTESGSLFRYTASNQSIATIFSPAVSQRTYTTASVIGDSTGRLYYSNDYGLLFAIQADAAAHEPEKPGKREDETDTHTDDQSDKTDPDAVSGEEQTLASDQKSSAQRTHSSETVAPAHRPVRQDARAEDAARSVSDGSALDASDEVQASPKEEQALSDHAAYVSQTSPSILPLILGGLGVMGLIGSGAWLLALKRQRKQN